MTAVSRSPPAKLPWDKSCAHLVAEEILPRREGARDIDRPAAVVRDELAHAPRAGGEVARDQAGFVDFELRGEHQITVRGT